MSNTPKVKLEQLLKLEPNELHKLAQKGAGLSLPKGWPWSPTTNDGDALRLLPKVVEGLEVTSTAVITSCERYAVVRYLADYVLPYDGGINVSQAIRDAIVLLAALKGANDE